MTSNSMRNTVEELFINHVNSYIADRKNIQSEFNAEKASVNDYLGRELLELLQNADDEITDPDKSIVRICFRNNTLTVENNGNPFSIDGVDSFIHAHLSPKKEIERKTIGHKGLGFRSILSWAKTITIDSGDLHIQFSDEIAQDLLHTYIPDINEGIKAPILPFPKWNPDPQESEYTTRISIEVDMDDRVISDIYHQIKSLRPEILLFLNNMTGLIIEIDDFNYEYKKIVQNKNEVTINRYDEDGKCIQSINWFLNKVEDKPIDDKFYSVIVAFPRNRDVEVSKYLVSYFPTKVYFPLNYLVHADFNLSSNRNELIDDPINRKILETVAEVLVDAALKVHRKKCDYEALSSLMLFDKDYSLGLSQFSFNSILREAIIHKELFPLISNSFTDFDTELGYYSSGLSSLLPPDYFENVLMHAADPEVEKFILNLFLEADVNSQFKIEFIKEQLKEWISSSSKKGENTQRRMIQMIPLLLKDYNAFQLLDVEFFVDEEGKSIPRNKMIFFNDEKRLLVNNSDIADIAFIGKTQTKEIKRLIKDGKLKEDTLSELGVRTFSANDVLNSIQKWFENHISGNDPETFYQQQLKWVWSNFETIQTELDGSPIMYFKTRKGQYKRSNELYMGKEYGNDAMEAILIAGMPDRIVEDLSETLEVHDYQRIKEFISYFGVAEQPRFINQSFLKWYNSDFYYYIFQELKYPVNITVDNNRFRYESAKELLDDTNEISNRFQTIDALEKILKEASTEDILIWIMTDKRLWEALLRFYDPNKELYFTRGNLQKPRPLTNMTHIRSYISFLFRTVPWVTVNGRRYPIERCLLEGDKEINIEPVVVCYSPEEFISKLPGKKAELRRTVNNALTTIGMKRSFGELSQSIIYETLLKLPGIEGSEKISQRLYMAMIRNVDDLSSGINYCDEYKRFLKEGQILCDDGYKPISEARYIDGKDICNQVTKLYSMVKIPRRQNRSTVRKLFGVEHLVLVNISMTDFVLHPLNGTFQKDFERYKTLAFAYRIDSKKDVKEQAKKFKSISISLCSSVSLRYKNNNIKLEDYEYFLENEIYYLCVPECLKTLSHNIDLGQAIASIICSYLDVSEGMNQFRELYTVYKHRDRMKVLAETVEDDQIDRALNVMNYTYGASTEFYEIFRKLDPDALSTNRVLIEEVDFDVLSSPVNAQHLIQIFRNSKIDFDDYNDENPESQIDLIWFYEKKYAESLPKYEDDYRASLFSQLMKKGIGEQKLFNRKSVEFRNGSIRAVNSCYFDVDAEIFRENNIIPGIKKVNFQKLLDENKSAFYATVEKPEYLEDFFRNDENESLLYFRRFDELKKMYEEYYSQQVKEEEKLSENDEIEKRYIELENVKLVPSTSTILSTNHKPLNTGYRTDMRRQVSSAKNGAVGERIVYDMLREKYGGNVKWVSENAKVAGINPMGTAGYHYDMEYVGENNELYFVEVKASVLPFSKKVHFIMSEDEVNFAKKHCSNYLLYYVGDLKGVPIVHRIENLFDEDDINRDRFSVEEETQFVFTAIVDQDVTSD